MTTATNEPRDVTIPARDGSPLAATVFDGGSTPRVVVVNGATAVPRSFYRHFASGLASAGFTVVTYDFRGVGGSRPERLRGFEATMRDWAFLDMAGVVDWTASTLAPERLFLVGHSFGGQVAGMLDRPELVAGMVTMSAQSGHWRLQGGVQKLVVWIHAYLTLPLLPRIFGYMPMRRMGAGEDLPAGVARGWARWCRDPDYLLGDRDLPLDRYRRFTAPVLAYSFADDDWGTARSVDAMMRAYPNVERRHVVPAEVGLGSIGHIGFFRPSSAVLWDEVVAWLDRRCAGGCDSSRGGVAP